MELSGSSQVFDAAFHPSKNWLATGLITGNIEVWKLPLEGEVEEDNDESDVVMTLSHHRAACRGLRYLSDDSLISISSDRSWALTNSSGKLIQHCHDAHKQALNKVTLVDENLFATGDDDGVVKLWDMRLNSDFSTTHLKSAGKGKDSAVLSWDAHSDFVSALEFAPVSRTLFSTAGDATLCVYDIRHAKNFYKSDDQEAELTSLCVLEGKKLVACGTDSGTLLLFKWGLWGDCSDRFTNLCPQANSVNSLCLMRDGHTILAGCGDGKIRACSLYPMRRLGELGSLGDEDTVEGVLINQGYSSTHSDNSDKLLMAGYSYSERVVLWDLSEIEAQLTTMATASARDSDADSDADSNAGSDSNNSENYSESDADSDEDECDTEANKIDEDSDENSGVEDEDSSCEGNDEEDEDNDDDEEESEARSGKNIQTDCEKRKRNHIQNLSGKKRTLTVANDSAENNSSTHMDSSHSHVAKSINREDKSEQDMKPSNNKSVPKTKEKRLKTASERFYADL